MKNSLNVWALVTDGGKARILSLQRYPAEAQEILETNSPTRHKPDRDLVSDSSGRSHNVRGPGSHVREPRNSAHDLGEQRFVSNLMKRVLRASQSGEFESLVLVADPTTLGNIRRQMSTALRQMVILELNRDLTGLSKENLVKRLREALAWPEEKR